MSWAVGYDDHWHRDIGYGVPAYCDQPRCAVQIDRGLFYVCGGEVYGGEKGCGLFFCSAHLSTVPLRCSRCRHHKSPFTAKPDHPDWIRHKLTDGTWAGWRAEHPDEVKALKGAAG